MYIFVTVLKMYVIFIVSRSAHVPKLFDSPGEEERRVILKQIKVLAER
jgi:hypothetical protein